MEKKRRPSHYNIIGKKTLRTKQRHKAALSKRTKALHAQGYSDISSYFESNGAEDLESSNIESSGTNFREEEQEQIIEQAQRLQSMQEEEEEPQMMNWKLVIRTKCSELSLYWKYRLRYTDLRLRRGL